MIEKDEILKGKDISVFKKDFIYFILERGTGGRKRERNIDV